MENKLISQFRYLSLEWRCFLAVAEEKNISQAGLKLGLPQSSITKYIQNLELELHNKLFHRSNRGTFLTDFGKVHFESLKKVQTQLYQQPASQSAYRLQIGMHSLVAQRYLPRLIHSLLKSDPHFQLEFKFESSKEVTRKVLLGEYEAGVVVDPIRHLQLAVRKIASEDLQIVKNGGKAKFLFFNPQMKGLEKLLERFRDCTMFPVEDYEVCLRLVEEVPGSATALPSSIRSLNTSLTKDKLLSANICYIYRLDGRNEIAKKRVAQILKGLD